MATIVTRAGKGSPLTHTEMDTNFTNLNTAKLEDLDSRSSISPSLLLDFSNTGVLDPRITFTRASVGKYINSIGRLVDAVNNVPRFDWASAVQVANTNLWVYTQEFDSILAWNYRTNTVTANAINAPDGTLTADKLVESSLNESHHTGSSSVLITVGLTYTVSIYAKKGERNWIFLGSANTIGNGAWFDLTNGVVGTKQTNNVSAAIQNAGNGWYRCSITYVSDKFNPYPIMRICTADNSIAYLGDGTSGLYVWGFQIELGSIATTYQAQGAFTPTNTPLVTASACNGLLIEESRANRLLWCRDITQTNWIKTNVTAAKDQTGIDGVSNAASRITASADGGTCIQTITLASGSRTSSVYLKRLTGTGNIQVTLDGSTWSTVDLSNGLWNRITLSGTVTNPTVGIKIAANGDSVAIDYGQVEDGAFATSPILTTTTSVTRAADNASMTGTNFSSWYRIDEGTLYAEYARLSSGIQNTSVFSAFSDSNNYVNYYGSAGFDFLYATSQGSAGVLNQTYGSTSTAYKKFALALAANNVAGTYNGTAVAKDTTYPQPNSFTTLAIGSNYASSGVLNGTIKRIAYYPKRLTNTELQSITS